MNVNVRLRNIFYLTIGIFILWLLYAVREILTPFVIALIFAYIFNPLINFFSRIIRIPRIISILLVYVLLITSVVFISIFSTRAIITESTNIIKNLQNFLTTIRGSIDFLPFWLRSYALDYINFLAKNQLGNVAISPVPVFSRAFSGVINLFIFLVSTFFFLKDGGKMVNKFLLFAPDEYRVDVAILIKKINSVLSSYLRGQIILIVVMMLTLLSAFSILGVRYAPTIAVASAFAGIIPIVGLPIAGIVSVIVIVASGGVHNFLLGTPQTIILVLAVYYVANQIQDLLLAPIVIGRVTRLHPLVALFSVLAGANIYGILGILLAVPVAASCKIVYEFVLDKIKEEDRKRKR